MKLTKRDKAQAEKYRLCAPKQFGNLHQRMKLVMGYLSVSDRKLIGNDLWQALFDLETEVSYYEPVSPPYGQRTKQLGIHGRCQK